MQRARLDVGTRGRSRRQVFDACEMEVEPGLEIEDTKALLALHHELSRAVPGRPDAQDRGDRADRVQVRRTWILGARVALQQQADLAPGTGGFLHAGQGFRPLHGQGRDHARVQDKIADWQDDEHVLVLVGALRGFGLVRHCVAHRGILGNSPCHPGMGPARPVSTPFSRPEAGGVPSRRPAWSR